MTQSLPPGWLLTATTPAAGIVYLGFLGAEAAVSRTRASLQNWTHLATSATGLDPGRDLIFHFDIGREGPFLFADLLQRSWPESDSVRSGPHLPRFIMGP